MNIIVRELRSNLKSLLIWSGSLIAVIVMMLSEFSAYYNNPDMAQIMESMPKALMDAFSMSNANLTTVSGYVSITVIYVNLMLGIYAVLLGNSIIAKEERDKTAGFLMTMPITRTKVLIGKIIAATINCMVLLAVVIGSLYLFTLKYNPDYEFYKFLRLITFTTGVFEVVFLSLGMFLASSIKRYKVSSGVGLGVLFALYVLSVIVALSEKIDFLKYVTPFKYFEASNLLQNYSIEGKYLILSFVWVSLFITLTFIIYNNRDLRD